MILRDVIKVVNEDSTVDVIYKDVLYRFAVGLSKFLTSELLNADVSGIEATTGPRLAIILRNDDE